MSLLINAQNNFYIITSCRRACEKKVSLNFMSLVGFQASKVWMFFGKFPIEQFFKSFPGRNNSMECHVFGFSNSLPYALEGSRQLKALISRVWG